MNSDKRKSLKELCAAQGKVPLVEIDIFFDGNEDPSSIGCNLAEPPSIETFRAILCGLKSLPGVKEVLACIAEVDPGETSWPFSDSICILGDVDLKAIRSHVEVLRPTDVTRIGFFSDAEMKALAKAKNAKLSVICWD